MIKDNKRFERMFGSTVNIVIQSLIFQNKIDYCTIESPNDSFIMHKISDKNYKKYKLTDRIIKALIKYGREYRK